MHSIQALHFCGTSFDFRLGPRGDTTISVQAFIFYHSVHLFDLPLDRRNHDRELLIFSLKCHCSILRCSQIDPSITQSLFERGTRAFQLFSIPPQRPHQILGSREPSRHITQARFEGLHDLDQTEAPIQDAYEFFFLFSSVLLPCGDFDIVMLLGLRRGVRRGFVEWRLGRPSIGCGECVLGPLIPVRALSCGHIFKISFIRRRRGPFHGVGIVRSQDFRVARLVRVVARRVKYKGHHVSGAKPVME